MASRKAQSKAGIAAERRGQQMGDSRSTNVPAKQEQAEAQTPALRGRRKQANKFYADDSAQAAGSNAARPRSNSPSIPAALPTGKKLGEPGGEKAFKRRQAKKGEEG
ncbi:MAG TPA: hypothetical protein VM864_12220 [Pyrinomonadaceae bacterium]|jgi:hypothetical protein|nr:hypothetical protein [Pyrinomonadaceae bacterium]